jgi:hypothetical protein
MVGEHRGAQGKKSERGAEGKGSANQGGVELVARYVRGSTWKNRPAKAHRSRQPPGDISGITSSYQQHRGRDIPVCLYLSMGDGRSGNTACRKHRCGAEGSP